MGSSFGQYTPASRGLCEYDAPRARRRRTRAKLEHLLPILCYHKVGPSSDEGRRLNVEPEDLVRQARFFARRGYRFLRGAELAEVRSARAVALTFDDAYTSALTHGVEALLSVGAVGTFYAVGSLLGGGSAWDVGNERPLADAAALRSAQDAGMEVGNHSFSHADLGGLPPEQQREELHRCHEALSAAGLAPGSVAYPYGKWNEATIAACRAAGYRVGLALGARPSRASDDRLLLPRIVVNYSDGLRGLLYKLYVRPWMPTLRRRAHYVR